MTTDGATISSAVPSQTNLPVDVAACHAMIFQLLEGRQNDSRTIKQLEHRLDLLLRRIYGQSREKLDPKQLALFEDLLKQLAEATPPSLSR